MCRAIFGAEYYKKKKILNLLLERKNLEEILILEKIINNFNDNPHIKSCVKGKLLRTHIKKNVHIIDLTNNCRIFSEILPNDNLICDLEYQGLWQYDGEMGHYWVIKKIIFMIE